jgi:pimeloyl-ACP methyl ester carboxylesterase
MLTVPLTEQHICVNTLNWFYREAIPETPNDKPPVVLLHGLVAQSYSYREVLPRLAAAGFRAIALDWLGHGFSDKPARFEFDYKPQTFVTAFATVLQALEIRHCSLVIQGFLGTYGLLYALQNPDAIARLVILNTPLPPTATLPWKIRQFGLPFVGDMATQDPLLVDRTLEGGGPYQVGDDDLDIYRKPFLTTSASGRALMATVQNLNLKKVLPQLEAGFKTWDKPTLVAWGTSDRWLETETAQAFAKCLKDGEFTALAEVGHYAQEDWPEKVSDALLPFLRKLNV